MNNGVFRGRVTIYDDTTILRVNETLAQAFLCFPNFSVLISNMVNATDSYEHKYNLG